MKILVFGAHPDDVELSVGGIVARQADLGHWVEICDLTAGEMGSNGTPQQRLKEGQEAAAILGAQARHVLRIFRREARERLHLPFPLLSDATLQLKTALRLPTFTVAGMELYRRLTLVIADGRILKTFYPVFPPDRSAEDTLNWLRQS